MATVVSFIHFKGGVGKTTLCIELAASLYKKTNARVLMVDLDPQSGCTRYWLNEEDWERQINRKATILSFFEACLRDEPFDISSIMVTPTRFAGEPWYQSFDLKRNRGIKLIPSDMALFEVDLKLAQRFGDHSIKAQLLLKKALKEVANHYDFIFIDCPPSPYIAAKNGIFASDYYVIVSLAEFLSAPIIAHTQAVIDNLFTADNNNIEAAAHIRKPLPAGIILNKVRSHEGKTQSQQESIKRIRDLYPGLVFDSYVPQSERIGVSWEQGGPIAFSDHAEDQNFTGKIHAVADEFLRRITNPQGLV